MYNPTYLTDYVIPTFVSTKAVIDDLQLVELSPSRSLADFATAYKESERVASAAEQAAASGQNQVSQSNAFTMDLETFRGTISQMWYTASYGAALHSTGAILGLLKQGKLSEQEAMAHADNVVRTMNAIRQLSLRGQLDKIKKGAVGLLPLAYVAVIAVVAVIIVAIIVYGIVCMKDTSQKNAMLNDMCKGASGDAQFRICAEAMKTPTAALDLNAAISGTATKVIIAGFAVLVLSFLPFFTLKIVQARRVAAGKA